MQRAKSSKVQVRSRGRSKLKCAALRKEARTDRKLQTLKQARSKSMSAQLGKSLTVQRLSTGLAAKRRGTLRVFPSCADIASGLRFCLRKRTFSRRHLSGLDQITKRKESKMARNRPQIMIADDHAL